MGWKKRIEEVLNRQGPLCIGDLIAALGFDLGSTALDVETRFMDGLKSLRGSFCNSRAQRVLGNMVRRGDVVWQRAANVDDWYRLPEQEFPVQAAGRERTLRSLVGDVVDLLPAEIVSEDADEEWKENIAAIKDGDVWVELCPFVISMEDDGWELSDDDLICRWAGNTFAVKYPMNVKPFTIVRRIRRELARYKKGRG